MVDRKPDCLKHCRAVCCTCDVFLALSSQEVEMLRKAGTSLTQISSTPNSDGRFDHRRNGPCGFEDGGTCKIDERKKKKKRFRLLRPKRRPQICRDFPAGGKACLKLREKNPSRVRTLTAADKEFQSWYYGWDE